MEIKIEKAKTLKAKPDFSNSYIASNDVKRIGISAKRPASESLERIQLDSFV